MSERSELDVTVASPPCGEAVIGAPAQTATRPHDWRAHR